MIDHGISNVLRTVFIVRQRPIFLAISTEYFRMRKIIHPARSRIAAPLFHASAISNLRMWMVISCTSNKPFVRFMFARKIIRSFLHEKAQHTNAGFMHALGLRARIAVTVCSTRYTLAIGSFIPTSKNIIPRLLWNTTSQNCHSH